MRISCQISEEGRGRNQKKERRKQYNMSNMLNQNRKSRNMQRQRNTKTEIR